MAPTYVQAHINQAPVSSSGLFPFFSDRGTCRTKHSKLTKALFLPLALVFTALTLGSNGIAYGQSRHIPILDATSSCSNVNASTWAPRQKDYKYVSQATPYSSNKNVYFLAYTPPSSDYDFQKKPLIIFMQGSGGYPNGLTNLCFARDNYALPQLLNNPVAQNVPSPETNPLLTKFVVITPQQDVSISQTSNGGSLAWDPWLMNELIDMAVQNFNVDPARIYLIGTSRGGGHVFEYLLGSSQFSTSPAADLTPACNARKIAAAFVLSANGEYEPSSACASIGAANLPIWTFSIEGDLAGGSSNVAYWVKDNCNSNPSARFSVKASNAPGNYGDNHWSTDYFNYLKGSTSIPYKYVASGQEIAATETNDLYSWLLTHSNASDPLVHLYTNAHAAICLNTNSLGILSPVTGGSYAWYPDNGGGTQLTSSGTYTTPALSTSQTYTYWGKATQNNACASFKKPYSVSVFDKNKSLVFSGSSQRAKASTLNPLYAFGTRDFTIETWFKVDRTTGYTLPLVSTRQFSPNSGFVFYVNPNVGGTPMLGFQTGSEHITRAMGSLSIHTWYHAAVTRVNNVLTYYIDGVQIGTTGTLLSSIAVNRELWIGSDPSAPYTTVLGIDEVRIWNVGRTASDIFNNKGANIAGSHVNLLAYYPFNDASTSQSFVDMTTFGQTLTRGLTTSAETSDPTSSTSVPYTGCTSGSARLGKETAPEVAAPELLVYPNPAQSRIKITSSGSYEMYLQFVDTKGTLVKETTAWSGEEIDISELKSGLYTVIIQEESGKTIKRLLVGENVRK